MPKLCFKKNYAANISFRAMDIQLFKIRLMKTRIQKTLFSTVCAVALLGATNALATAYTSTGSGGNFPQAVKSVICGKQDARVQIRP